MAERVLIVGGYGTFGGRLAQLLAGEPGIDVIVAGRSLAAAEAFCRGRAFAAASFDRDGDVAATLTALRPTIVVDAAGPFQGYGDDPYRLARATLATGAHYLDLSDCASFTAGIATLDAAARGAGRAAISGASSVPAISSAAVERLGRGLREIALIETTILPGNRAPRGLSLMRAVLAQAGRPLRVWRDGAWDEVSGWSAHDRRDVSVAGAPPIERRWSALIDAPDLALFPARYGSRSVLFRAGLEVALLHRGLAALAVAVRRGWLPNLARAAPALRWIAERLRRAGSDRGGMIVDVVGRDDDGSWSRRRWSLIVEAGDGPSVPAMPAALLIRRLAAGTVAPGARACLGELDLGTLERALTGQLRARAAISDTPAPPLYARVLGSEFAGLAAPIRRVHEVHDLVRLRGEAAVADGGNRVARLVRRLMRLPPPAARVAVEVTLAREGDGEAWTRSFGRHRFRSRLSAGRAGTVVERFGPLAIRLLLRRDGAGIAMPIDAAFLFGVRLPGFLTPSSRTREFVDGEGRFNFDVDVALPAIGRVVRYQGWLLPLADVTPPRA